ncbi:MAG TPA: heavy metal-responsive transcriptional regulator [candidate division Zixibacteria bacterium]|nr:heavy metal-responsive transcriptional regulator [candidate division Zixibacteria bacterium]
MRIGELADRTGLAPSAVRYYEQLGLLPEPTRTASGYRSYGEEAVDRIAFIRSAQAVGLTLAEIRRILAVRDAGEAPCRVVSGLIARRHADVRARIAELRSLERDLRQLRARAERLAARDCDPSGICHVIPNLVPAPAARVPRRGAPVIPAGR